MVVTGRKLHPLWQTQMIPLLALISAITMGYSIVIFEAIVSSVSLKREIEVPLLSKLSALIPWLIGAYLVVRFGDLLYRGQLGLAFTSGFKGIMFIIENVLYIVPLVILSSANSRMRPKMLFVSAVIMLLAGAVYRFDTFLIGFDPGPGWHYFPSAQETLITVGLISMEIAGYMVIVKKLPVLPDLRHA